MSSAALRSSLSLFVLVCGCPVVFDDALPTAGDPGHATLTRSASEPPGEACPYGGLRVEHGVDDDGDGALSDAEVDGAPAFVCDGAPAAVVRAMLVEVDDAPVEACAEGGARVRVGVDGDGDAILDDGEVSEQAVVCDGSRGAGGAVGLIRVSPELPGASCVAGGQRIDAGIDQDGDATLDDTEVALTRYLCDGEDGADGPAGSDASLRLVRVVAEPAGDACGYGGQRVETGVDADGDAALDDTEVEGVAYVCDAAGEGVVLGAGRVEGTAALPVPLTVDASEPRLSTVAALSTSYYGFTSLTAEARYTIVLVGEDSTLAVGLFDDAALTNERVLSCVREAPVLRCATELLPADTALVLTVSDGAEVANSFGLLVSLGADDGSADAPVALTDDGGVPHGVRVGVGPSGASAFSFHVPRSETYTLSLSELLLSAAGALTWRIEDDLGVRASGSDAAAPFVAGYLEAGVAYRLFVEAGGPGAAFGVSFIEGDTVTPTLPLDEIVTLDDMGLPEARVFQLRTNASTDYTFRTYSKVGSRALTIFDAPPETEGRAGSVVLSDRATHDDASWIDPDFGGHVDFLAPDRVYYVAIFDENDTPGPVPFHVASRGGDETSVPLVVGVPLSGSLARESSYTFTTGASAARYSITFDTPLGSHNTLTDVWLRDVSLGENVAVLETPTFAREADDLVLVTPALDPGRSMELFIGSYTPTVYAVGVEEGDTVTAPLALDEPLEVSLAAGGVRYLAVDVAQATAATLSASGNVRALLSDGWPEATGSPYDSVDTAFYCSGSACAGDVVLPPGRSFLSLENPLPVAQTVTVELAATGPTVALDDPIELTLKSEQAARFWYVNDSAVPHLVTVENLVTQRRYRFRLRRASDFGIEYDGGLTTSTGYYSLPTGDSSASLPTGAWILEVDMDTPYDEGRVRLTLTRP